MPRDRVRERITSLDVARRAGVSQSAVSRTFTPDSSVSAKTAEKVRQAAAELSYRPNILARSLITGKSHIIGVLVSYLDNFFYIITFAISFHISIKIKSEMIFSSKSIKSTIIKKC